MKGNNNTQEKTIEEILFSALDNSNTELALKAISQGTDIMAVRSHYNKVDAIICSVKNKNIEVFKKLLEIIKNRNYTNYQKLIENIAESNSIEMFDSLLKTCKSKINIDNKTILNIINSKKNSQIFNFFIKQTGNVNDNINVNFLDNETRKSPLFYAINNKDIELCRQLINRGAIITEENKEDLICAIKYLNNQDIINQLLKTIEQNNINIKYSDEDLKTLLSYKNDTLLNNILPSGKINDFQSIFKCALINDVSEIQNKLLTMENINIKSIVINLLNDKSFIQNKINNEKIIELLLNNFSIEDNKQIFLNISNPDLIKLTIKKIFDLNDYNDIKNTLIDNLVEATKKLRNIKQDSSIKEILEIAIGQRDINAVKKLAENKITINKDSFLKEKLDKAIINSDKDMFETLLLIENAQNILNDNIIEYLTYLIKTGNYNMLNILLDSNKVNLQAYNTNLIMPLLQNFQAKRKLDIIKKLLHPNILSAAQINTILNEEIKNNNIIVIDILLNNIKNLNESQIYQRLLLASAIKFKNIAAINLLLPHITGDIIFNKLQKLFNSEDLDLLDNILKQNINIIKDAFINNNDDKTISNIFNGLERIKGLNSNEKNVEFQKIFANILSFRENLKTKFKCNDNVISKLILLYLQNSPELFNNIDINSTQYDIENKKNTNLLKNAIKNKDLEIAEFLISKGANLKNIEIDDNTINGFNFKITVNYNEIKHNHLLTLPMYCISCGYYNVCKILLDTQNIDINTEIKDHGALLQIIAGAITKKLKKTKKTGDELKEDIKKSEPGLLESFEIVLNKKPKISDKLNILDLFLSYHACKQLEMIETFKELVLRNKNNIQTILANSQYTINNYDYIKNMCNYINNIFRNQNMENFTEVEQNEVRPRMQNQQINLAQENHGNHQNQEIEGNIQVQNQNINFVQFINNQRAMRNDSVSSVDFPD